MVHRLERPNDLLGRRRSRYRRRVGGIEEKDKTPQAKALDRLMRSEVWRVAIYPRLLKMARPLAGLARLQPSDLAQMAIVRIYAVAMRGEGPTWDVVDPEVFLKHMMVALKGERWNVIRRGYVKLHVHDSDMPTRNPHDAAGDDVDERYTERAAHPDGTAVDAIARRRALERAEETAGEIHDALPPLAQKALRAILLEPGEWDPQAFADEHKVPVRDVYMARREITRKTEAVTGGGKKQDREADEDHDEDDDA
jgi:hypothetical protein